MLKKRKMKKKHIFCKILLLYTLNYFFVAVLENIYGPFSNFLIIMAKKYILNLNLTVLFKGIKRGVLGQHR